MPILLSILAISSAAAVILHTAWLARSTPPESGSPPRSDADGARHLRWGLYVDPNDSRGWVPKPGGRGHTVNFRTSWNAAIYVALVGTAALSAMGLVASVLMSR